MLGRVAVDYYSVLLLVIVVLALGGLVPYAFIYPLQRLERIGRKIYGVALDLGRLKYEFAQGPEVALDFFSVAAAVLESTTPEADIVFDAVADF